MRVLVIHDDLEVQVEASKRLMSKGFQVIGMESPARACNYVKIDPVDVLVMGDRVGGLLSHAIALAAECANPMVTTIILTERKDREIDELYDLLPSLYALLSPNIEASIIAQLALTAVANPEGELERQRRNAVAKHAQPALDWSEVFTGEGKAVASWDLDAGEADDNVIGTEAVPEAVGAAPDDAAARAGTEAGVDEDSLEVAAAMAFADVYAAIDEEPEGLDHDSALGHQARHEAPPKWLSDGSVHSLASDIEEINRMFGMQKSVRPTELQRDGATAIDHRQPQEQVLSRAAAQHDRNAEGMVAAKPREVIGRRDRTGSRLHLA